MRQAPTTITTITTSRWVTRGKRFTLLSETHLSEKSFLSRYELNGYNLLYRNREQGKGGGVAIFIKNNINFKRSHDLEKTLSESLSYYDAISRSKRSHEMIDVKCDVKYALT